MDDKEYMLAIYFLFIVCVEIIQKLGALFGIKVLEFNKTSFPENNNIIHTYLKIYFLLYITGVSMLYAILAVNYNIGYYVFLIIFVNLLLSLLLFKIVNPKLTKIMNDDIFNKYEIFNYDQKKVVNIHYYINTFFQVSFILNTIVILFLYF